MSPKTTPSAPIVRAARLPRGACVGASSGKTTLAGTSGEKLDSVISKCFRLDREIMQQPFEVGGVVAAMRSLFGSRARCGLLLS
jgi:hypothetical protein